MSLFTKKKNNDRLDELVGIGKEMREKSERTKKTKTRKVIHFSASCYAAKCGIVYLVIS